MNARHPSQTNPQSTDWSRTPAAMVCVVVLGAAAIVGLGWSLKHQADQLNQRSNTQSRQIRLLIDLNTADQAQLQMLPSIGPKIAQRIIEDRQNHGVFESVSDLDRVYGIGPKTIEKLQDWAMVSIPE
jgi:competence protein ComEA